MKSGRPPYFETPEELEERAEKYFSENERPTVSGLSIFLGFSNRRSMYDYKNREQFSHTIEKIISKIESKHEENLYNGNCTGSIFWLKNRDWSDKTEHDHNIKKMPDWLTDDKV